MKKALSVSDKLRKLGACSEALLWAEGKSTDELSKCNRVDWLLWLDRKLSILDDKELRLLACYFARHTRLADGRKVWDLLTDERSRNAVRVSERYARGMATEQERDAAWDAAGDAAWDAAGYAAWDAARYAAWAAARYAAWDAARAAAWDAAWEQQARYILRKYIKRYIAALNRVK